MDLNTKLSVLIYSSCLLEVSIPIARVKVPRKTTDFIHDILKHESARIATAKLVALHCRLPIFLHGLVSVCRRVPPCKGDAVF